MQELTLGHARRAAVLAACVAAALACADAFNAGASIDARGLFAGLVFRGAEGGRTGIDARIVLDGLWPSSVVALELEYATKPRHGHAELFGNRRLVGTLQRGAAGVLSGRAQVDPGGRLLLRINDAHRRPLMGVSLGRLSLRREGSPRVAPGRVLRYSLLGLLLAPLLPRRRWWLAALVSTVLAAGALWLCRLHVLALLDTSVLLLAVALAVRGAFRFLAARTIPRDLAGWLEAILVLRLFVALYPGFDGIDATFHARKAHGFLAGAVLVSRAPGVATAWYPPAYYVPLALLPRITEQVIDVSVVLLETAAALVLFAVARAGGLSRQTAAAAAVTALVLPEGMLVLCKGIACNVFASFVSHVLAWIVVGGSSSLALGAVIALLLLSHAGGAATMLLAVVLSWVRELLSSRDWLKLARHLSLLAAAALVAWLVYYREVPLRLLGSGEPLLSFQSVRLLKFMQNTVLKFGLLPLGLAAYGLGRLRAHERLQALFLPWAWTVGAFVVLALLTPWPLRVEYFAVPLVAILAGLGAERLRERGRGAWVWCVWGVALAVQCVVGLACATGHFQPLSVIMESPHDAFAPFR